MTVMRGLYFIVETERRLKGWHSHACNGTNPLCKLDGRQVSNQQKLLKWEYEDSVPSTILALLARKSHEIHKSKEFWKCSGGVHEQYRI